MSAQFRDAERNGRRTLLAADVSRTVASAGLTELGLESDCLYRMSTGSGTFPGHVVHA
jgi:hypothetical protein